MTTLANPRSLWDTLPAEIIKIITGLATAPIILMQRMFRGAVIRRRFLTLQPHWTQERVLSTGGRWVYTGYPGEEPSTTFADALRVVGPDAHVLTQWRNRLLTPRYLGYTTEQRARIFGPFNRR